MLSWSAWLASLLPKVDFQAAVASSDRFSAERHTGWCHAIFKRGPSETSALLAQGHLLSWERRRGEDSRSGWSRSAPSKRYFKAAICLL